MSKFKHEESFRVYMHERIKNTWLKSGHTEEIAEATAKYAMETCVYPSELRTWCDAKEESASKLAEVQALLSDIYSAFQFNGPHSALVDKVKEYLSDTAQPDGCPSCKGTGEGIDMGDCVLVSCMCNGTGKLRIKDKS